MSTFRESDFISWRWKKWLDGYPVGAARIDEGRKMAQRGDVETFDSSFGLLRARVVGRSGEAFQVQIDFSQYEPAVWDSVIAKLESLPELKEGFTQGYVSDRIEEVFAACGVRLFPDRYKDVRFACSCPDWIKPCKHALAVLHAFSEYFRTDSLLLAKLRGYGRPAPTDQAAMGPEGQDSGGLDEFVAGEDFYGEKLDAASMRTKLLEPIGPIHYVSRLGRFVFWGMKQDMEFSMRLLIDEARNDAEGLRQMLGEQKAEPPTAP